MHVEIQSSLSVLSLFILLCMRCEPFVIAHVIWLPCQQVCFTQLCLEVHLLIVETPEMTLCLAHLVSIPALYRSRVVQFGFALSDCARFNFIFLIKFKEIVQIMQHNRNPMQRLFVLDKHFIKKPSFTAGGQSQS